MLEELAHRSQRLVINFKGVSHLTQGDVMILKSLGHCIQVVIITLMVLTH